MTRSGRFLVISGLLLAVWGMTYGLYYAVFVEHQTLDSIGSSLTNAFVHAAEQAPQLSQAAMQSYASANYNYVRQVDAHGHWIGLGLLLIVLGIAFSRVGFSEAMRMRLAAALFAGAILFPLGVLLETVIAGSIPKGVAILGSALVIAALAGIALGFSTNQPTT
ncbi:MAG: hypothetical protein WCB14_00020 [Candidatus Acidiferrales bacterium]